MFNTYTTTKAWPDSKSIYEACREMQAKIKAKWPLILDAVYCTPAGLQVIKAQVPELAKAATIMERLTMTPIIELPTLAECKDAAKKAFAKRGRESFIIDGDAVFCTDGLWFANEADRWKDTFPSLAAGVTVARL